jgi:hypothetical protein
VVWSERIYYHHYKTLLLITQHQASAGIYNASAKVNGCTSPAYSATIVLNRPAIANAGNNQGSFASLNQFVNAYRTLSGGTSSAVWTQQGSGNFSPGNSNLITSYYPSATDKSAGSVGVEPDIN